MKDCSFKGEFLYLVISWLKAWSDHFFLAYLMQIHKTSYLMVKWWYQTYKIAFKYQKCKECRSLWDNLDIAKVSEHEINMYTKFWDGKQYKQKVHI